MFKTISDSLPLWPRRERQTIDCVIPKAPGIPSNTAKTIVFFGMVIAFIWTSVTSSVIMLRNTLYLSCFWEHTPFLPEHVALLMGVHGVRVCTPSFCPWKRLLLLGKRWNWRTQGSSLEASFRIGSHFTSTACQGVEEKLWGSSCSHSHSGSKATRHIMSPSWALRM